MQTHIPQNFEFDTSSESDAQAIRSIEDSNIFRLHKLLKGARVVHDDREKKARQVFFRDNRDSFVIKQDVYRIGMSKTLEDPPNMCAPARNFEWEEEIPLKV